MTTATTDLGNKAMYQFSYAEVLDETPKGARERERQAIDRSIELLRQAEQQGVRSREASWWPFPGMAPPPEARATGDWRWRWAWPGAPGRLSSAWPA